MTIRKRLTGVASLTLAAHAAGQATTNPSAAAPAEIKDRSAETVDLDAWWNHTVWYEVFVRSFADSSSGPLAGDGVGDLQGLLDKLDYLNDGDPKTDTDLGVTGLWLMPMMESPSYHGYDVTDYNTIKKQYGTNELFKTLVAECRKRGIRIVLDFVPNHCSSEHPWFKASLDPADPKHEWFVWSKTDPGWKGPWDQTVWHPHPVKGAAGGFYYGLFWKGMPDLNFRNPEVTRAMEAVVDFWLDPKDGLGVDGLRIDAIRHLIEEGQKQESTPSTHEWLKKFHTYYKSKHKLAWTVGEVWADSAQVAPYVGGELDSCFEFHTAFATIDSINEGKRDKLEAQWSKNLKAYPRGQYSTFLSNHDQDRVMSRFGGGRKDERSSPPTAWAKSRLAAVLLLTSPGIPFLYYGEEIGMVGVKPDEDIRTPMQWSRTADAGFTAGGKAWRRVNADYQSKNVEAQSKDPTSLLNLYKKLIRLRKDHRALRTGTMEIVDAGNPAVWAFLREDGGERFLVVVNLSAKPVATYGLKVPDSAGGMAATEALTEKPASRTTREGYRPAPSLPALSALVLRLSS